VGDSNLESLNKVNDQVPDWINKMKQYAPKALAHYTMLSKEILVDGKLSEKEKELILVGVNAGRRNERSMLFHTKNAINLGATVDEIADIITTCIISRGIPAWLTGIEAIKYAVNELNGKSILSQENENRSFSSIEECLSYYKQEFETLPDWVELLKQYNPEVLFRYSNLRNTVLVDRRVSRKIKELVLVAINICEHYKKGIDIHINNAKELGANDDEIAEVSLLCVLTAGIPAWIEGSEFLAKD
jgi:alkylhydroperoxidase/carboxymuconolactone decarboxylase family protein YurZ